MVLSPLLLLLLLFSVVEKMWGTRSEFSHLKSSIVSIIFSIFLGNHSSLSPCLALLPLLSLCCPHHHQLSLFAEGITTISAQLFSPLWDTTITLIAATLLAVFTIILRLRGPSFIITIFISFLSHFARSSTSPSSSRDPSFSLFPCFGRPLLLLSRSPSIHLIRFLLRWRDQHHHRRLSPYHQLHLHHLLLASSCYSLPPLFCFDLFVL